MKYYYFSASWCAPCKAMKPQIQKYEQIEIIDVDTDEGSRLAGKFQVRGVPTLIATPDGKRVQDQVVGLIPATQLANFMEKNV